MVSDNPPRRLPPVNLGTLTATRSIVDLCGDGDPQAAMEFVFRRILSRFLRHDWGDDMSADDCAANDRDLIGGDGHVLASYLVALPGREALTKIWVEHYPHVLQTCVMLPEER